MIYVKFNSDGKSVEMTNIKPESSEYIGVSDELMGITLKKEGDAIRPMTEQELEESLAQERAMMLLKVLTDKSVRLLKDSEYLVMPDAWESYTKEQKDEVISYRNFLKNIDKQEGFPLEIVWPTIPNIKG
jgi:hypothetical protein